MATVQEQLENRAGSALQDLQQNISEKAYQAEAMLEKASRDVGNRIGAMVSDVGDSATRALRSSRDFVKEHPVQGVAYAAAAGLVAGSLLTVWMASKRNVVH